MKYDFLIVGAGLYGATFARIATELKKTCLIIDKFSYIGGMAADKKIENIYVSEHGGHIFNTNNKKVWDFLNRFSTFNNYVHRVKAFTNKKIWSFPINLMTLNQLWGVITPDEALEKLNSVKIPCPNPSNLEEWSLSMIGKELYYLFYYGYTKAQWGKEPKELPASIIKRIPIRLTYDDRYFSALHEGMPTNGYTELFNNILNNIDVELGVNFFNLDWKKYAKNLVYSGSIDRLFNYEYGKLDYRTLNFENKVVQGDFQGNASVNYCDGKNKYIRIIEHKHCYKMSQMHCVQDTTKSVITYDIPVPYNDNEQPYYPLRDSENTNKYNLYKKLAIENKILTGGRLGSYTYLNLDQVCSMAINDANTLLNN